MDFSKIVILAALTVLTGLGDSQGFLHASKVWNQGEFVWLEAVKSATGILVGTLAYWGVVKFLQEYGVRAAELQTLGWFAITIIGVAVASGKFLTWTLFDQIFAFILLLGIASLIARTGM